MKASWLGCLARPDLCFIIGRLACRVASWTHWGDKQLLRMISYPHGSSETCLAASVCHHETLQLHIYTDSDFASCPHSAKSTSGIVFTVEAQHSLAVHSWKEQTSVARSTPEAESIAMASAVFGEALNAQTMLQHLVGQTVHVVFHQNN